MYDKDTNKFNSLSSEAVTKIVELNQDLYVNVIEHNALTGNDEIVSYGNKLERFAEAKYSDAFYATFMTNKMDQIVTSFTHSGENNRKIEVKIGKVTDTSILNKLKNQDSTGFSQLLQFAKTSSAIYDKTLDADKDDNFAIEYNADEGIVNGNPVIDVQGLQNEEYYYLYIKTDDENGKYISNEAVTLAQANINISGWSMFFYGSSDFKWADFGEITIGEGDNTIAPTDIPKAGLEKIISVGVGAISIGAGIVLYKKYKEYQGI